MSYNKIATAQISYIDAARQQPEGRCRSLRFSSVKAMKGAWMRNRIGTARGGFTLVELLLVIIIGAVLLSMAIPSFTRVSAGQNARNARDAVVWMGARARSRAIERGQVTLLGIDPANERAWIVFRRTTGSAVASDTLEATDFGNAQSVQLSTASNNKITLCYNARGYAFTCTGTSPGSNVDVTFTHAGRSAVARVKPLGQIERL
jgi:prepilin-type N-terminal cleavage/methylation domain-containing protein